MISLASPEADSLLNAIPIPHPKINPIPIVTPHGRRPLAKIKKFFRKALWNLIPCTRLGHKLTNSNDSVLKLPTPPILIAEKVDEILWDEEDLVYTSHKGEKEEYQNISLGEKLFSGKYKVVRKLGYGKNGTVWLAKVNR